MAYIPEGGINLSFHPRILGTPAPVFPGYEVDVRGQLDDEEKPDAVWHRDRAKQMIRAHPEIKGLFGRTPSTAIWCGLLVAVQIGLAIAVSGQPMWVLLLAAYTIGCVLDMNLFMLAHECNHSLVFKRPSWNRLLFTLTTAPMFMSAHHTWWIEHHIHHKDLGASRDFIKRRRTFLLMTRPGQVFGAKGGPMYGVLSGLQTPMFVPYALLMLVMQVLRSVLGLIAYFFGLIFRGQINPSDRTLAILADEHLVAGYQRYGIRLWAVIFPLCHLGLDVALFAFFGWKAVAYLLLSQLFQTGFLHPVMLGMILSNSHFHGHNCYQPSASYYGWFNWITFNFGLHTEHHDLMNVPWSRLPKLRRIATEFYDDLVQTPSYMGLALQFIFGNRADFDNEVHRNFELTAASSDATKMACANLMENEHESVQTHASVDAS